jgi:hypothetical protein
VVVVTRACLVAVAVAACAPALDDDTAIVSGPRLLAARAEPAEVAPGDTVAASALWVDPAGEPPPLDWAFCTARKAFSEPGPVAAACLVEASPALLAFGTGDTATGAVPANACRQFGPDAPDPVPGETAGRPVDPDGTGGFYQPIRLRAGDDYVLDEVRIRCGLPGATPAQAAEFRAGYVANANPEIASMIAPATAAPGETVALELHWTAAESYLWFDPVSRSLAPRREGMRVSWFATAGDFASGRGGRREDELETYATGAWTAPASPGDVQLWAVLRDDRGGAAWTAFAIAVR